MTVNSVVNDDKQISSKISYKLEPPEGGWGYLIVISMAIMNIVTVVPLQSFGLIYGKFLESLGDEASSTANVNGIFNTFQYFMGLIANHLMKSYSSRFVGILGSILFFTGNLLTVFASSLGIMIVTMGVLEGLGFGLMLPAIVTTFNRYFIKRKSLMMSISMALTGIGMLIFPYFVTSVMHVFGYRGTLLILSAVSLHAFFSMLTLHPVEWHMKKVISVEETAIILSENKNENQVNEKDNIKSNVTTENLPATSPHSEQTFLDKFWFAISNFLEFSLLQDPLYMNIAVGVGLVFLADIMFLSMLPMFLRHMNYDDEDTTLLMTVLMGSDLTGRICLSVFNAFVKISSRKLFFIGTCMITVLRIGFIISSGSWIATLLIIILLGYLRCLTQVMFPLVLAEYSQTRFPAAFGLYLAISGIVSFISGQLSSLVALNTTGDTWVQLLFTFQGFLCVICWSIEKFCNKTNI